MFRAAPDTEVATMVATSEPIPLSILGLDLPVPVEGWPVGRAGYCNHSGQIGPGFDRS